MSTPDRSQDPASPLPLAEYARSFGSAAAAYAAYRPGYAAAAIDWALAPVRDRKVLRVLDLGAGTGILTRQLIALGVNVIAVEPDEAMRAELLGRTVGAAALAGSAEAIPLPDNRVDAVLVGQAFHWFDAAKAMPEIARVLNRGGVLAALWNLDDDRVEWVDGLHRFLGDEAKYRSGTSLALPSDPRFGPADRADFPNAFPRTRESLVATMATHSARLVLNEANRVDWQRRTLAYLNSAPDVPPGEFDYPLVTVTVRAKRH